MKLVAVCLLLSAGFLVKNCIAGPVSAALSNDLSNSVEDEEEEEDDEEEVGGGAGGPPLLDDDSTTHGMERLSSAATCLVAGVEYTHGQQIYRRDQCEFCLCLDGEMFCWWQDCPPAMEGPCKDRGPFSPCTSVQVNPQFTSTVSPTTSAKITTKLSELFALNGQTSRDVPSKIPTQQLAESSTEQIGLNVSSDIPIAESSTSNEPKQCIVMGQKYQIGDKLPHDTGNCLECICDQGAKISCSPHQCTPAGDEINDYHPPGSRQAVPDIF